MKQIITKLTALLNWPIRWLQPAHVSIYCYSSHCTAEGKEWRRDEEWLNEQSVKWKTL